MNEEEIQYEQAHNPGEEPVVVKPKKKSVTRYYGMIALGAIGVSIFLLLLLIIFVIMNTVKTSRVNKLTEAYEAYSSGDTTALTELEDLAEKYEPAQIVVSLLQSSETAATTQTAAGTVTGQETVEAEETFGTATTTETTTAETQASSEETQTETDAEPEEETQDTYMDEEVEAAIELWEDGSYSEAKEAFDSLAASGKLDFDPETADEAILEYGAACGMLDLYNNVSKALSYEDLLIYDYEPEATIAGYDFTKPVYSCEVSSGTYLCAYSTSSNSYVYWCDDDSDPDAVDEVTSSIEYDLLSATTMLSIRKQLQ